jgi:alternate signal-mediated exported protein
MRSTTRSLVVAAVLGVMGVGLLLGGTGSLATWQESASSPQRGIETGSLDLGPLTSGSVDWRISQRIPGRTSPASVPFTDTALVPGDVLTGTVSLPVELVGQTLVATLEVAPTVSAPVDHTPADTALASTLTATVVSIDGIGGVGTTSHTFTGQEGTRSVPVVIEVAYPWGASGQSAEAVGGSVEIAVDYTLSQNTSE